jgi:hypothetical protein
MATASAAVDPQAEGLAPGHNWRTEANSRLTSMAGLVLFLLLAVLGVTILRIHQLLVVHLVVGFALIGPLAVKLGSTGWRFVRYYTGDSDYRRAGPPRPLLRLLAPLVVVTTLAVIGTGIALVSVRPGRGSTLLFLHKVSFILWFGVMTVHVLAYVLPAARWARADVLGRGPAAVLASRRNRQVLIGASLVVGFAISVAGVSWAHAWISWAASGHGGDR